MDFNEKESAVYAGYRAILKVKIQPVVHHWTNEAGWLKATSNEVMRMKAVNHKPMNNPRKTTIQGGEEVNYVITGSLRTMAINDVATGIARLSSIP